MITIDNVLVHLGPTVDVIRLDGKHFLQGIGGTVCLQSPDFHLTEALTTKLSLTTQRLLGNQAVGAGGTSVHLVIDQVVELEHVHVAHSHRAVKCIAGTAVIQLDLATGIHICQLKHTLDLGFFGTIEDRCRHRNTFAKVTAQLQDLFVAQAIEINLGHFIRVVVDLVQQLAQFHNFTLLFQHTADLFAQSLGGCAEMGFQNLTNVHPRRYTQRVQHDINGGTVLVVRHIFNRHNRGDNTLVTVTTGHLVARLNTTLDSQVHLDDLQHARGKVVALLQLAFLVIKASLVLLLAIFQTLLGFLQQLIKTFVFHAKLEPVRARQFSQVGLIQLGAFLQTRAADYLLAIECSSQTLIGSALHNAVLVFQVFAVLIQLLFLDRQSTSIFLDTVTGEYLNVDNRSAGTGRHTLRGIFNVRGLFTEDGTQQLLFRGQLGFALRRYLAHQNVARADFCTDVNNTGLIQLGQRAFTNVRNIRGDFFATQLGIPGHTGQFLNVDSSQAVFLNHFLGDKDGILKVVTVPGHERDAHVLAQRQLTQVHRGTISQYVTPGNFIALAHDRTLVDTGVLVGAGVLGEVVDIHTSITGLGLVVIDTHHDTGSIDTFDDTTTAGSHTDTGILRHGPLNAGTYQGHLGLECRHGLTLHVRPHQGPVGVIVFEERNQGRRHRNNLARRYVHEVNRFRRCNCKLVLMAHGNQFVGQTLTFIGGSTGLSDHIVTLFNRREVHQLVSNHTFDHSPVRAFKEAVGVSTGIGCQRVDQTDVRAFRRLDRTHATVMSRVNVSYLKAGALASQATWPQRGDTTLVSHLRQRVVLIHELGQLTGTEELFNGGSNRLGVDQVLRHQAFAFGEAQALANCTFNPHKADPELVLSHFTNAANTTVTQVIDVIYLALTVTDSDQGFQYVDDIVVGQSAFTSALVATEATVKLHPANAGQVIALFREEQVVKQVLRRFLGGRLARAHHAVDFNQSFQRSAGRVDTQGIGHERTTIQIVGVQGFDVFNTSVENLGDDFLGQLGVTLHQHFASRLIDHVLSKNTAVQVFSRNFQLGNTGFFKLLDMTRRNTAAFFSNDVAILIFDIKGRNVTPQPAWHQLQLADFFAQGKLTGFEEHIEHLLGGITQTTQENRGRQLATTVDTNEHGVLRIELEVQPGATVRNHPR